MKRNSVRFLLILLLAFSSATIAGNGNGPYSRPFMGNLSGDAAFDFSIDSCIPITGAPWQTVSTTVGQMMHLGRTEYYSTHCSTLDGSALVEGRATLVAANGDEVFLTYTAKSIGPPPIPPVVLVYLTEYVVVGGTGRFEGASGEIIALVFVTIEDFTAPVTPMSMEFAGHITY